MLGARIRLVLPLLLLGFLAFGSCGGDDRGVPTKVGLIDESGGTIRVGKSVTIIVPPGAWIPMGSDDATTGVREDEPLPVGAMKSVALPDGAIKGTVYQFIPAGHTFLQPVEIRVQYSEDNLGGANENNLVMATAEYDAATAYYTVTSLVSKLNPENNTVGASTKTWSSYFYLLEVTP